MILCNFISLRAFTVYMENSLLFEISLRSIWPKWNLHRSEFHYARSHVNADNEVTSHWSEILPRTFFWPVVFFFFILPSIPCSSVVLFSAGLFVSFSSCTGVFVREILVVLELLFILSFLLVCVGVLLLSHLFSFLFSGFVLLRLLRLLYSVSFWISEYFFCKTYSFWSDNCFIRELIICIFVVIIL